MVNRGLSEEAPPFQAPNQSTDAGTRMQLRIGDGGRVVIPAEMRAALGVKPGDTLLARVVDGELMLLPHKAAVRRAQLLVRSFVPDGVSLVDELIAERRAEAARETSS